MRALRRLAILTFLVQAAAACATGARAGQVEGPLRLVDQGAWLVGEQVVTLPHDTAVTGVPALGARVRVDGTWGDAGELIAHRAQVLASPPSATPEPTRPPPTATPAPARPPAVQSAPPQQPAIRAEPPPAAKPKGKGESQGRGRGRGDDDDDD